ncbi:MAG: GvpL/GvpF family gas vesicle protein [Acidobacteriota bacterium]
MTVYAIVSEDRSLDEGLRLVRCGEVSAVVGEAEATLTPEALAIHDAVVRRLADCFEALLPVRFGETMKDEAELAKLLAPRSSKLLEALERVRGCAQMTLRVFGDPEPLPPADEGGPGTRYLEARRRARSLPEIQPLLDALRPLLKDERTLRHDQGSYFGTAYHLVRREDVPAYLSRVESVRTDRRVTVSGPWAPYAFAPGLGDPS